MLLVSESKLISELNSISDNVIYESESELELELESESELELELESESESILLKFIKLL